MLTPRSVPEGETTLSVLASCRSEIYVRRPLGVWVGVLRPKTSPVVSRAWRCEDDSVGEELWVSGISDHVETGDLIAIWRDSVCQAKVRPRPSTVLIL
jgi:hypothetical protein